MVVDTAFRPLAILLGVPEEMIQIIEALDLCDYLKEGSTAGDSLDAMQEKLLKRREELYAGGCK